MNKAIILSLILSLCSISSTFAQKKPSPRDILDRTTERLMTTRGISAKFTTTLFQGTTPQETINGTIDIQGQKYTMKTQSVCTWFNGKDQWTLIPANKEVSLVTPTQEEIQVSSPTAFMQIYKHGFNISSKTATLRGRKVWEVTMRPNKRKQEPSSIVVSIDKETYDPLCIRIRNNGDWTRISITDFKVNTNLSEADFEFQSKEYPDFEIIDMR